MIWNRRWPKRRGNVVVLTAVLMTVLMGMLAFSLDLGYIYVSKVELQRTADSAALAATWELIDAESLSQGTSYSYSEEQVEAKASEYAALNPVLTHSPSLASQDIQIGFLSDPFDPNSTLIPGPNANAVSVRVHRDTIQNGNVSLFFGRLLGTNEAAVEAEALAAVMLNMHGFQMPSDGGNLGILPITLDEPTWNDLLGGTGSDDWKWDEELEQVVPGADGFVETDLYPRGNGPPGNRGTVDIGSNNNSTADISRQIVDGLSSEDLDHHNGKLEFDSNGELELNGDTGISAGIKDELQSIIGEPRIIPIFRTVQGPGNNAQYTILAFAGIRILDVKLTGSMSSKRVIIQPAKVVTLGGIPSPGPTTTYYVYSPAWLVR